MVLSHPVCNFFKESFHLSVNFTSLMFCKMLESPQMSVLERGKNMSVLGREKSIAQNLEIRRCHALRLLLVLKQAHKPPLPQTQP